MNAPDLAKVRLDPCYFSEPIYGEVPWSEAMICSWCGNTVRKVDYDGGKHTCVNRLMMGDGVGG